jgi:PAS domain S-box-containing protein
VALIQFLKESVTQTGQIRELIKDQKEGQSNALFRLLVESVKDYAIFVIGPDGHVLTWNLGAQALKGYSKEEIIGKHFSVFYPAEAIESGWPMRELFLAEKEGRFEDEGWRVRKDGSTFWASVVITALRGEDGQLAGFAKVTQDMSQRRQTEERIQNLNRELRNRISQLDESQRIVELRTLEFQNLSARVLRIQDEERRRIARDLHDDLGQQLAALKMILDKNPDKETSQLVDSAIKSVRNLSYLLHPPLLDETGLHAALHWFVEGLIKRSGLEIQLILRPISFPRMTLSRMVAGRKIRCVYFFSRRKVRPLSKVGGRIGRRNATSRRVGPFSRPHFMVFRRKIPRVSRRRFRRNLREWRSWRLVNMDPAPLW